MADGVASPPCPCVPCDIGQGTPPPPHTHAMTSSLPEPAAGGLLVGVEPAGFQPRPVLSRSASLPVRQGVGKTVSEAPNPNHTGEGPLP